MTKTRFLGLKLTRLRESAFLSQQDIADIIGVKRKTYAAYEQGRCEPPLAIILKLCFYFKVSFEDMADIKCVGNKISNHG